MHCCRGRGLLHAGTRNAQQHTINVAANVSFVLSCTGWPAIRLYQLFVCMLYVLYVCASSLRHCVCGIERRSVCRAHFTRCSDLIWPPLWERVVVYLLLAISRASNLTVVLCCAVCCACRPNKPHKKEEKIPSNLTPNGQSE